MRLTIRPESEPDRLEVRTVNKAAFETAAEANLVDALRKSDCVTASLVAEADGRIVGHILFSRLPVMTGAGTVESVSLAPMAVLPGHQRQGIGSRLVKAGLEASRDQGHRIVVVLGQPDFYARFGFSAELARPLKNPFGAGEAWMAMELIPGALHGITGRVEYPAPFTALE